MKPTTNPALTQDALHAKSQLYIRRGLRAQSEGGNEEYQLWASLSLELLGKAALAKVHPALVADPRDSASIFAACGRQISADLKTIGAHTLFERLSHIEKAFDTRHQMFCKQMALRRNAELHSGESPFSGMSAEVWEREFWGAVELVLKMQNESLESWLGVENAKAPAKIIEQAEEALTWAVQNRIARCKEDFQKSHQEPKKRAQVIAESKALKWWEHTEQFRGPMDGCGEQECPACSSQGFLAGGLWHEEVSDDSDPDDPMVEFVDKIFAAEEFFCPICGLHLFGTKEVAAANLPDEFTHSEVRERVYEGDYGND